MGEKPFEGLTEEELLVMEEEELLARGIEYMSKEKDDLKHKMKQVLLYNILALSLNDIFLLPSIYRRIVFVALRTKTVILAPDTIFNL